MNYCSDVFSLFTYPSIIPPYFSPWFTFLFFDPSMSCFLSYVFNQTSSFQHPNDSLWFFWRECPVRQHSRLNCRFRDSIWSFHKSSFKTHTHAVTYMCQGATQRTTHTSVVRKWTIRLLSLFTGSSFYSL